MTPAPEDHDWYTRYRREVEAAFAIRKKMEAEYIAFAAKAELERSARQWAIFTAQQNTRLP